MNKISSGPDEGLGFFGVRFDPAAEFAISFPLFEVFQVNLEDLRGVRVPEGRVVGFLGGHHLSFNGLNLRGKGSDGHDPFRQCSCGSFQDLLALADHPVFGVDFDAFRFVA